MQQRPSAGGMQSVAPRRAEETRRTGAALPGSHTKTQKMLEDSSVEGNLSQLKWPRKQQHTRLPRSLACRLPARRHVLALPTEVALDHQRAAAFLVYASTSSAPSSKVHIPYAQHREKACNLHRSLPSASTCRAATGIGAIRPRSPRFVADQRNQRWRAVSASTEGGGEGGRWWCILSSTGADE